MFSVPRTLLGVALAIILKEICAYGPDSSPIRARGADDTEGFVASAFLRDFGLILYAWNASNP